MQKNVIISYFFSFMLLSVSIESFCQEKTQHLIIGDGWKLKITHAILTPKYSDASGIIYALPGQSLLVIFIEKIKEENKDNIFRMSTLEEAKVKDAKTGKDVLSEHGIRSTRSEFKNYGKKNQITTLIFIASVPENKKDLVFEISGTTPVDLQNLLQ